MFKINGRAIAQTIKDELAEEIRALNVKPKLGVILVGDDPASQLYVNLKEKAAHDIGIATDIRKLPATCSDDEIIAVIDAWNQDASMNAMIVQIPLPPGHDTDKIVSAMDPKKDADGFHPTNMKALSEGRGTIFPPVHEAALRLIASTGVDPRHKAATIIANSDTFAAPLAHMLQKAGCITATVHPDLLDAEVIRTSDIIVIAIGRLRFLGPDLVKPGAVIIDVGTNKDPHGKVCGDADEKAFADVEGWITPVPGGIGPMTVALLLKNVVQLSKNATLL